MTDAFLINLILYIIFMAFGYTFQKDYFFRTVAGVIGLLLSVQLMNDTIGLLIPGFAIMLFSIYVLFTSLYSEAKK